MGVTAWIAGGSVIAGLLMLLWGWRGRRLGDHPHCRGCGFDLFALPGSTRCPECGHRIDGPKDRVIGERRRRRVPLTIGVVLLVGVVGFAGLAGWRHMSRASLYHHAPGFYVLWCMDDAAARAELVQRIGQGRLAASSTADAVSAALDVQGNPAVPWDTSWGEIIEQAATQGRLTPAQRDRYARQIFVPRFSVRPRVQRGREPGGYISVAHPTRAGPHTIARCRVGVVSLRVDGEAVAVSRRLANKAAEFEIRNGKGYSGSSSHLPLGSMSDRLGEVPVTVKVRPVITLTLGGQAGAQPVRRPTQQSPTQSLSASVEVVDHRTAKYLGTSVSPRRQAERAGVWFEQKPPRRGGRLLLFAVVDQPCPVRPIRAWLRVAGKLYPLNHARRSGWSMSYFYEAWSMDAFFADHPGVAKDARAQLIIRPDIDDAETTPAIGEVWPGQWVFQDLPLNAPAHRQRVRYDDATTVPTVVPARAEVLSLDEVEHEPSAEGLEPR